MARTEAIRAGRRGWRMVKSGIGRARRRLPFVPRQRCANQRPMHRTFFFVDRASSSSSSSRSSHRPFSVSRSSAPAVGAAIETGVGLHRSACDVGQSCSRRAASLRRRLASGCSSAPWLAVRAVDALRPPAERPAHTAPPASRSCAADAAPSRACIRARRRTSCSASASRRRRPSRRRHGWSRAARADSNRPECHQAEAGAAASKTSRRNLAGGERSAKGGAILAERFRVAIARASYRAAEPRLDIAQRRRTAAGAVDCGVRFAATDAAA